MFRLQKGLVPALIICLAGIGVHAQPFEKKIWVGKHLHEVGTDELDRADAVADYIDLLLGTYKGGLTFDAGLQEFLGHYDVEIDPSILTRGRDREAFFVDNSSGTLFVASGRGVGPAASFASGLYLGPRRPRLGLEAARVKLLAVETNSAAEMYFQLLLHYALIKDALNQGMDRKAIVTPLISKAIDLLPQAEPAEPALVSAIKRELNTLLEPAQ
ncbi:hypothetical protein [Poseidonocella sedimentorum]|uniref:Uncharacterized protein n=1 Tax=Poseidonocella sedimentorum TaxID=871652 RepID=A0A1I6DXV7_9RHOB|nr:hypothetical protein [Poseidonocella sedimentorum]SFR10118.1 hypothetical protein SAMN04515673_1063 [Poseidonocella sedimentorum]